MGKFEMEILPENMSPRLRETAISQIKAVHKGEIGSYNWEEDEKITLFSGEFIKQSVVIIEG